MIMQFNRGHQRAYQADVQSVTPFYYNTGSTGSQWACNSASYNNVTSSMQCNVTRAQRAPRAYQKAAKHACYTGFTGSKRISTAFINISHYICHNFGYTGQFWLKFRLIAVP